MKIGFPYNILDVCPLRYDGPYIWSQDCTFAPTSFRENLIFSPLFAYSPTPKANKGFLEPPNTDRNVQESNNTKLT
jgi:hypothetical protein